MATASDERQLFVDVIGSLLKPVVERIITEVTADEQRNGVELPLEEFIAATHERLLIELYDLGQRDMKIGIVMMPLMAHLRKMPKGIKLMQQIKKEGSD